MLTIDQSLQYEVEQALVDAVTRATAKGGLAVVMDIRTGDILAMANVTGDGGGAARPANNVENNKAVTDVYEPGSTNKVITMSGAIEEGLVTPETRVHRAGQASRSATTSSPTTTPTRRSTGR